MLNERIIIKGTSKGLVVTIGPGGWEGLIEELDVQLGERASFFKGGRVALHVGPRQLSRTQLEAVGQILSKHQVSLWAVESEAPGTQEAALELGLETSLTPPKSPAEPYQAVEAQGNSMVIRRTLRSGQVFHHPGHIVVIGDVNPGAEIRAGGSVIVWGRLRGIVHAGADDGQATDAVVCALHLNPMQLRIGNYIARAPAEDADHELLPEMASVQGDQIVAEPWNG
jgi:septum site-determining protein MinC